ncbi:MAG: redoxin domain-containing protein [Alphaproteobacteria bacterium]|nr:redoxin domain-containing protein [Alphaproteobacteria bacterium]
MMATVLTDLGEFTVTTGAGDGLWLTPDQAAAATGWSLRPEGLCRGDVCVPVPKGREAAFVADDRVNLAAFWAHLGMPAAHSGDGDVWVLGEAADDRAASLRSLEAPDFTLPDLHGTAHSLSDYRGKKVLLATWASW